jgi:hypothetical protein
MRVVPRAAAQRAGANLTVAGGLGIASLGKAARLDRSASKVVAAPAAPAFLLTQQGPARLPQPSVSRPPFTSTEGPNAMESAATITTLVRATRRGMRRSWLTWFRKLACLCLETRQVLWRLREVGPRKQTYSALQSFQSSSKLAFEPGGLQTQRSQHRLLPHAASAELERIL